MKEDTWKAFQNKGQLIFLLHKGTSNNAGILSKVWQIHDLYRAENNGSVVAGQDDRPNQF